MVSRPRSRRSVLKRLGLGAGGIVAALAAAVYTRRGRLPRHVVCPATTLDVGAFRLFDDPRSGQPCILIRQTADRFVAYSRTCTHESCAVTYRAGESRLQCPCHGGAYAVEDGRVLQGPPPRGLDRLRVAVEDGDVVVGEFLS
jgi:Rieske Fe-S protein